MRLLKFDSYDQYKAVQVAANRLKFRNVFAEKEELCAIARHYLSIAAAPRFGLCHGVRNGFEVQTRRRLIGGEIQGTDISDTALQVPNCFVWDMHDVKPEWQGSVDFMYSNSWDHTYDPELLFARWASCLSEAGRLYVTWTKKHSEEGVTPESRYDAFGCSLDELIGIVRKHLALEDVLVSHPRSILKMLRKRLYWLKAGQISYLFGKPLAQHRMVTLVFYRRKRDLTPLPIQGPPRRLESTKAKPSYSGTHGE